MPKRRKPSPAQLRARARFAAMARRRSKTRGLRTMARRRSRARASMRRAPRRRRGGGSGSMAMRAAGAMAYGAFRAKLSAAASPVTDKLGVLGGFADNAVLGGVAWYAAKKTRGAMREVALAALSVEAALAGNELANNLSGASTPSAGGSLSPSVF